MPVVRIVKVEETVSRTVDIDEIAVVVVTVFRVKSELERTGASVEHGDGAEVCVIGKRGAFAQNVSRALQQQDWTRKYDREQHASRERVTVVGNRAERDTRAKGHTADNRFPFCEISNAILALVIPIGFGSKLVPGLVRIAIRFHVHCEQTGRAVDAETGGKERNSRWKLRREIEREIRLRLIPVLHPKHRRGIDLHIQRDQIEFHSTLKLLFDFVVRNCTGELQRVRHFEVDGDAVQRDLGVV